MSAEDADTSNDAGVGGKSQAALLVRLARERFRPVLGTDGRAYAVAVDGPNLARPLVGRNGLKPLLARIYADACQGAVPNSGALADAVTVLDGYARDLTPEPVYLRVAPSGDGVVLDLGTPEGRCVEIRPDGWRRLPASPVLFRRSSLIDPLPEPLDVGVDAGLQQLRGLLNVDERRFRLLVAWLVAALLPGIAHPILALWGEQGTAKSTATTMLIQLVDPSPAPLVSVPQDIRTWAVTALASWTIALDNCSGFPEWFSDTLCKAVTGDGLVQRALHTDDDLTVLTFRRVIALNGVEAGHLRGDLAERLLTIELDLIPPDARKSEKDVYQAYEAARPAILGSLLTLLSDVLTVLPDIQLDQMPRMADFARVLAALDKTTGWTTSQDYAADANTNAETVVDSDPWAAAIVELVAEQPTWSGTTTELLAAITPERPPRGWPTTPQAATGKLRRVTPALRLLGLDIVPGKGAKGKRTVTITRTEPLYREETPENTPPTPPTPPEQQNPRSRPPPPGGVPGGEVPAPSTNHATHATQVASSPTTTPPTPPTPPTTPPTRNPT